MIVSKLFLRTREHLTHNKKFHYMDGNLFPSLVCVLYVGIWNCSVNRANTDYVLCQYVILHNLRSAIQHYYLKTKVHKSWVFDWWWYLMCLILLVIDISWINCSSLLSLKKCRQPTGLIGMLTNSPNKQVSIARCNKSHCAKTTSLPPCGVKKCRKNAM